MTNWARHGLRVLERGLLRTPLPKWLHHRGAEDLTILGYHEVRDEENFDRQLNEVCRTMHPVGPDRLLAALTRGRPLPRHAVLITFDDGDPSVLHRALPVLRQRGIPAIVFVVAGLIDTEKPFWWEEVEVLLQGGVRLEELPTGGPATVGRLKTLPDAERRQLLQRLRDRSSGSTIRRPQLRSEELRHLNAHGVAVGNHTYSHPCLDRCPDRLVTQEIEAAHDRLVEILGDAPKMFAYPNGNYDPRAAACLRRLGYEAAFLFDHRRCPFPPADPLAMSRLRADTSSSSYRFRSILHGLHPLLYRTTIRRLASWGKPS